MNYQFYPRCCLILILVLLSVAACSQQDATPTTESPASPELTAVAQADTATPTPLPATHTPSPEATIPPPASPTATVAPATAPSSTPTAGPTPLSIPTPVPLASSALSPDNAAQIVRTGRLGWGLVDRVRFSTDGQLLAVATNLGIFLHDAQSGEQLQVIEVSSPLVSFNFSPDGSLMASGHNDRRIRIWRVSDGALFRTIEHADSGAVWSVAFSPDGRTIASSITNESGLIYLWRVSDGALLQTFSGHLSRVRDVVFSPDGRFLASASIDWEIRLWRVEDGSQHARLRGHQGPVWRVVFTPDSQTLISAGSNGEAGLWRVEDGSSIVIFEAQRSFIEVVGLAVSPDGQRFYTAAEDGFIHGWDLETQELLFEQNQYQLIAQDLAVSPDGSTLAAQIGAGSIVLIDALNGELIEATLPYDVGGVFDLVYSPDGSQLLLAAFDDVKLWPGGSESMAVQSLTDKSVENIQGLVYDPNGRYYAAGSYNDAFWIWDAVSFRLVGAFQPPANLPIRQAFVLAASGNGQRLAVGWFGNLATISEINDSLRAETVFELETAERVSSIAFGTESTLLFVGEADGRIEGWLLPEAEGGELIVLPPLLGHEFEVSALALTPDEMLLISADKAGRIIFWDLRTGDIQVQIETDDQFNDIALSPDGRLLAAGGLERNIRIWDVADARLLRTLTGPQSIIRALTFSPDGATLASGSYGGEVYFWGLPGE